MAHEREAIGQRTVRMSSETICHRCGHENQEGYNFCSQCGRSKYPPTEAREFLELVDVHPEADLTPLMKEILGAYGDLTDEWMPSIPHFQALCHAKLTRNQRQCLYRRYVLHLPGPQLIRSYASIAHERGGSQGTVSKAVSEAIRNLEGLAALTKEKVSALRDESTLSDS